MREEGTQYVVYHSLKMREKTFFMLAFCHDVVVFFLLLLN